MNKVLSELETITNAKIKTDHPDFFEWFESLKKHLQCSQFTQTEKKDKELQKPKRDESLNTDEINLVFDSIDIKGANENNPPEYQEALKELVLKLSKFKAAKNYYFSESSIFDDLELGR